MSEWGDGGGEMSREIKFRAWDGRKMFNVDVLAISKCSWGCPDHGRRGMSIAYQPHVRLMQFTGLCDKKSEEIYEGDIARYDGSIEQPGGVLTTSIIARVCIEKGMTYLRGKQEQIWDGESRTSDYNVLLLSPGIYEIVGNLYENPELMEVVE